VRPHRYHPDARAELIEQIAYYESASTGLGDRFLSQIIKALNVAGTFPQSGFPYVAETRRVFPKDFKFSLAYYETENELVVMAVASFSREPGYWTNRSRES
jgi:ParE toxin of type II toxin-antitoxin system, parDE